MAIDITKDTTLRTFTNGTINARTCELSALELTHNIAEDTVSVKMHGELVHKRVPLGDFEDGAAGTFATYALLLTYVAA